MPMPAGECERSSSDRTARRRKAVAGVFLAAGALAHPTAAFLAPPSLPRTPAHLRAMPEPAAGRGELVPAGAGAGAQLTAAFSSLDRRDKYDAVLAGLCAKLVDGGAAAAREGLGDPLRLLDEMTAGSIVAGPRATIGLIDATALTSDARLMADTLSRAIRNGVIARYGQLQGRVRPLPRAAADGRPPDLDGVPPVPDDDRAAEVTQAAAFGTLVAACVGVNAFGGLLGQEGLAGWANLVLGAAIAVVVVDNFFDALVLGGSAVTKLNEGRLPEGAKNLSAPAKEDMPLGIGTGRLTGAVVRGLGRLMADNTERDCQCEAAAVFTAYGLGLPCFAFQPNALEGATLVLESAGGAAGDGTEPGAMESLASDAGVLKVLIWLLAPVAMELARHPQLLSSEPRESRGCLQRLVSRTERDPATRATLADALPADDVGTEACLRWALAEADAMLRDNARTVEALAEALAGGAATVGDCVAVLEEW